MRCLRFSIVSVSLAAVAWLCQPAWAEGQARAAWMSGRYGLMVHWLFERYTGDPASVNGPVDAFDLKAFMDDFDKTGADWLIFTIGQNTGAYASPNSVIDRLCGPGHCSRRDLVAEIAAAVRTRGKRFIAYLPVDCLVPSIQQGMGWTKEDLVRRTFQENWAQVIREWAVRLGPDLDGWFFDGAGPGRFPHGFDAQLWSAAARAGNPNCALAYNNSLMSWRRDAKGEETLIGVRPTTDCDDYLAGEFNFFRNARIWTGQFGVRPDSTWMPESATVSGTRCQTHALFCLDGFWPCWAAWPADWAKIAPFAKRLPGHFSKESMSALCRRGEFPDPILELGEFRQFMTDFRRVDGGVTVNVGITPKGRLNPKSLAYLRSLAEPSTALVESVNPLIGAVTYPESGLRGDESIHGFGKTFPGAATPFGRVQLSPDTVTGGDNGPGYSYTHKTIEGFSFFHMSGIGWYGEFGNFQVMPGEGEKSRFSHDEEKAEAGFYRVRLPDAGVMAELTAAKRAGMIRFTYEQGGTGSFKIDLARRIGELMRAKPHGRQTFRRVGTNGFVGEIVCDHRDGGWGRGEGKVDYTLRFKGLCSKPLDNLTETGGETNHVVRARFPVRAGEQVVLHVAFDFCGEPETPVGFDFDAMRGAARNAWSEALDCVSVTGGTARERTIFATALYHAMLDPREVGSGEGFVRRTVFSGWDVYRSEMPLLALIRPDVVSDTINSMMETVTSGKRRTLPRWDIFGCDSGCMIGQPIVSVMALAYERGIRTFDAEKALALATETLEAESNDRRLGYTPDSLSKTLEYAYADWCCGRLAEMLGKRDIAARYFGYAQAYTNCWSPEVGWMRTRTADGGWLPWQGREKSGQGCVEANPWQQGWFVPHDPQGLIALMGGRAAFTRELNRFFSVVPDDFRWNDAYNHPNEPCHTLPFLWALSDAPERVDEWVGRIRHAAYGTDPFGLCGNEDVGQMSAWYVLAAIGLHPLCPGDGKWYLCAPVFDRTVLSVGGGKTFTILARRGESKSRTVRLNGTVLSRPWITTSEIVSGGTLEIFHWRQLQNL